MGIRLSGQLVTCCCFVRDEERRRGGKESWGGEEEGRGQEKQGGEKASPNMVLYTVGKKGKGANQEKMRASRMERDRVECMMGLTGFGA